jgi:hypothetical protein
MKRSEGLRDLLQFFCGEHELPITLPEQLNHLSELPEDDYFKLQEFAADKSVLKWLTGIAILEACDTLLEESLSNSYNAFLRAKPHRDPGLAFLAIKRSWQRNAPDSNIAYTHPDGCQLKLTQAGGTSRRKKAPCNGPSSSPRSRPSSSRSRASSSSAMEATPKRLVSSSATSTPRRQASKRTVAK